jgi:eukaryotic-like serine/threonine-protein kinase
MEHRKQVEEIFHEALERDPTERDAYLRKACGNDSGLRREIADLLAHYEQSAGFEPWAAVAAAQLIAAPASLQAGQLLGPYRIDSFVAAGGMGQVYRATDTRLHREVAIKACAGPLSERFALEAKVIASLNHPHICHLYDVGSNYLVMEFVEGTPLRGPLPLKLAVEYAGQILDALDAAHRKGITHRDLKPANVLVTKQGVKLLDFGLAKRSAPLQPVDATLTTGLTAKGEILGTLHYMSPEQLHGKEADARSDLFSFGCVLYEMLSGKRAFEGQSAASVIASILEREPAPIDLAPTLERIIRTCLAKDPDQRFQNAVDLKRNLTWSLEQPITAKTNRRAWIAGAATATLVLLGALGGWAALNRRLPTLEPPVLRLQIDPPPAGRIILGGAVFGDLAISPDGKMAAYTASVNGKAGLWVRPLNGSAATLLQGTENGGQPRWSPDSKSIAFVSSGGYLHRVNLDGGMPVGICNPVAAMRVGTWGSDGYILFTGLLSGRDGVYRVPASGGTASLLIAPDVSRGEIYFRWPQVLPRGRFLYFVQGSKREMSGVYAASLSKPAERIKVLNTTSRAVYASDATGRSYLLWNRAGSLVAQEFNTDKVQLAGEPQVITADRVTHFASANGLLVYGGFEEANQLAWLDRKGTLIRTLGEPLEGIGMARLSPDERQIVVQRQSGDGFDLWVLDLERGVWRRLTAGPGPSVQPVWSPDSQVILFTHFGARNLLRKAANGAGDEQVIGQRPNDLILTDWSGRWVLTREISPDSPVSPETDYDIWKLPVTADGKMQPGVAPAPYLRTPFKEGFGRLLPEPNPRWIAYQSDQSGRYEVYVDSFPEPRKSIMISTAGGSFPKWRADGRELFYVSPENKVTAASLKLGADSVEASAPRELFSLPPLRSPAGPPFESSRDGQRFIVLTSPKVAPQSLNIIVNWPALLNKNAASH